MSVYSTKKGWRYDFTRNGQRYTGAWFKTKRQAKGKEAERRERLLTQSSTPTDMAFSELVNRRLDHIQAWNSRAHYVDYRYLSRKWAERWDGLNCSEINGEMIEAFILERNQVSAHTANKELRSLRSLFNFGKKKKLISENPSEQLGFLPVEKRLKRIPLPWEIDKVIALAEPDFQDYLWTIRETMARVSEINRLTWDDVDLEERFVILYTRKKRGGHLTPRKVPMTEKLHSILSRRCADRDPSQPFVFWHKYWSNKTREEKVGPYKNRRRALRTLCERAGVKYFGFHALRHAGASVMEQANVPVGSIQRILGHESRRTTEIYLHSIGQAERQAMAMFEQVRSQSLTQSLTQPTTREQEILVNH